MKFTKEQAYEELVSKMTTNGETLNLSQRSINEQLENLMPLLAQEDTELEDFVNTVLPVFKIADANIRHDVSVGIADFKKKNATPPIEKTTETGADDDDDALMQRISALEGKLREKEAKDAINENKKNFLAKVRESGVKDEDWLSGYMENITISEDFDVEDKATKCVAFYNKTAAKVKTDVTPQRTGGKADEKYLTEIMSKVAELQKLER